MVELIVDYVVKFGWQLALIALSGVIILSVLKECKVFGKLNKGVRHILYLVISVVLSASGSAIYLVCMKQFAVAFYFVIVGALFALNQTWYGIISSTPIGKWMHQVWTGAVNYVKSGKAKDDIDKIKDNPEGTVKDLSKEEQKEIIKEEASNIVEDIKEIINEVKDK